ncbi:MAG: RagB/SusD family nutrient uptake outer membrane protein, partial [Duncaniella sp.]|nr:RagB/SusD family nutrient uptake outer membrane protein [Duncaniella sp.]
YKGYYEGNGWNVTSSMNYDQNPPVINPGTDVFRFPMPDADVVFNPNLLKDPVHVDVRREYSY